ncbi:MAG: hypothetical protein R3F59_23505 [Myxococcota bacterium]
MIAWLAAVALAGPCDVDGGLPTGPAQVALWDGDLGRARPVCARTQVALAPRALLLVDTPAFYGRISALAGLEGTVAVDRTALWLRLEPVRYESVISAIPSSFLGYGYTSVGVTQRLDAGGPTATAFHGTVVLPTAVRLQGNAAPLGLDLAFALDHAAGPWSVHGQAGYAFSASLTRPAEVRTGFTGTGGGQWRPGRAFAAVLDLQAAISYTAPLDHLAVAPALRFGAGPVGIELAGTVPVAGRERALAAVSLRGSVRR